MLPPAAQEPSRPAAPVLEATAVVRRFGGHAAVDGLSFAIRPGEILGLVGPNGAGKTTMFDCLAGSRRLTSGRIALLGRSIERLPAHARVARGLCRTFQIPRPFGSMSVLDNVMLGAQHQRGEAIWANWLAAGTIRRQERALRDRAMEVLAFVDLAAHAERPAKVLSGGQRKLLELARVLMAEPKLVLLDEPAAGIAPALREAIATRIAAIRDRGVTVLLIEHDMAMVRRLCSRVLVMAEGRLLAEGTPAEIARDAEVVEAYLGRAAA